MANESKDFFRALLPIGHNFLPSPPKIFSTAVSLLGKNFKVSRAVIFAMQRGRSAPKAAYEYCADSTHSIMGKPFPHNDSPYTRSLFNSEQPLVSSDVMDESRLSGFDLVQEWSVYSIMSGLIKLGETVVGIVCLQQCDKTREWTAEEISQFKTAVNELSLALEIVRPFAEMRKRFEHYSLINELGRQMTLVTNPSDLFHTLVTQLRKIFSFDFVAFNLIDETSGRLHNVEQARYSGGRFNFGHFLPAGYAIPGWCIANRRPMVIRNLSAEHVLRVRREWLDAGLVGCAAFPLIFNDELTGAILFFTRSGSGFKEGELQIMQQGVEQASASFYRIRVAEQLVRSGGFDLRLARREELIKRISKAIGSHLDADLVLQHAVNELGRHLAVSRCYVIILNQDEGTAEKQFEYRSSEVETLVGSNFPLLSNPGIAHAVRDGKPVMFAEVQSDEALKPVEEFLKKKGVRSTLYHLIAAQDDLQAFLCLDQCDRTRTWTEDECELVVTVSQELAIALEQAELVAKLQSQAEREALLNRITAAIRGSLDLGQILQTAVEELSKTLNADHCFIGLVEPDQNQIVVKNEFCSPGIQPICNRSFSQKLFEETFNWQRSGQFTALDHASERMVRLQDASLASDKLRSIVYVPVRSKKKWIAVIGVGQMRDQRHWKKQEMSFLRAVADQVAVAISQARLLEQSKTQAEREALLNRIFKSIADSLDPAEIMEKVVVQLGQALEVSRCTVSLFDSETNRWLGIQNEYLAPGIESIKNSKPLAKSLIPNWIYENQKPYILDDVANYPQDEGKSELLALGMRSLLLVPILQSGKVTGTIGLHRCDEVRQWTEPEVDLVRSIASQVAVAIHNAYLFKRIADSQQHWQKTFDSMTDGVAVLAPSDKVVAANHALMRMCDYSSFESILGRSSKDLFQAAPGTNGASCPAEEAFRAGASFQVEIQDVKGRVLLQNIDPVIDESGAVTDLILVIRDVTKERRAEQETAQRNRELSVLNAISEEITKSLEIDKIITSAFSKAVEVMGADAGLVMLFDEAQEQLRPVAYHGQLPEVVTGILADMPYKQGPLRSQLEFKETIVIENFAEAEESLDEVFVEISKRLGLRSAMIANLQSKNRTLGLLTVAYHLKRSFQNHEIQLITAIGRQVGVAIENARLIANLQDALQRLREANRLKDEFLATLSHELRTPLTSITGWSEILSEREDNDEEMATGLKAVLNNAESLQQLINDLLELSRIENRVLKLDIEPTDVNLIVMSAVQTVKQMADNREIAIEQDLVEDLPYVNADGNRLQQVFWNLLSNSIKFSRRGGYVRVRTSNLENAVEIRVEDNGIGIEASFLPMVFERFRQADSSSTRRYGGLGIGLSLVKSLVEVHGGEVKVESPGKDKGSTFIVRLPVPQRARLKEAGVQGDPKESNAPAGLFASEQKQQALIIEDLEDNLRVLSSIMERLGYQVINARNTEAGLRMAERYTPKVILIDINMPGRSPFEVMAGLKSRPELSSALVIAVSGISFESERQQALAAGFAGIVTKPFRRSELMNIIKNCEQSPQQSVASES